MPELVQKLESTMRRDDVMDALEILSKRGYIRPTDQIGCGLRICSFEIRNFGFERYLVGYYLNYEERRQAVISELVALQKDLFESTALVTEHILDKLVDDRLIEMKKFFGGRIKILQVSAELRRNYEKSKATRDNSAQSEESLSSRASKLAQGIRYKQEREAWRNSERGCADAGREVERLFNELRMRAKHLTDNGIEIQTQATTRESKLVWRSRVSLHAFWSSSGKPNNLEGSRLRIELGESSEPAYVVDKYVTFNTPIRVEDYDISLAQDGGIGWVERGGSKQILSSPKIAEMWVHVFFERIEKVLADD